MSGNVVPLIVAITALVTALGTLLRIIFHIRSVDAKSASSAQQSAPAQANDPHAENHPYNPQS